MKYASTRSIAIAVVAGLTCSLATTALADIEGFERGSYQYNPGDTGSPPVLGDGSIQLTTGRDQRRSLFFYEPQDINAFSASFRYRAANIQPCGNLQGLAFVVQNHPDGVEALGDPLGGLFGPYGLGYQGMENSAAITIELDTGPGLTYSGFYSGGILGGGAAPTTPVNAFNGNDIDVFLDYAGSILTVTMRDTVTGESTAPKEYLVGSLSSIIGSDLGYVGFTASTGGGSSFGGMDQHLSNFSYTTVPAPGAAAVMALAGLGGMLRRRR